MKLAYHLSILSKINQPIYKSLKSESMAEVKQSLQKTASKEQENYKSVFLKKRSLCNRQSVYISGEIQKRIMQIVGVITNKQVSIGSFIDNVLEEHLNTYNDVLSALYREEMQKGIFNQPKENKE
jgi:hypothetical protein